MMTEMDLDWLNPDHYGEPVAPDAKKPPIVKLALEVMDKPEDAVLCEWIQLVYPQILDYFSFKPGKGMSEEAADNLIAQSKSIKPGNESKIFDKLVNHEDQSLAVHLLNAALGGWTLVKLAQLDELEQKLYLAAVTLHDLNKIVLLGLGTVRMDGFQWQAYRQAVQTWGEALGLWKFISRDYWQDIAFLAQNAESSRGENLTPANHPDTQLPSSRLTSLVDFVQFADLAASIAKHPNDLEQKEELRGIVHRKIKMDKYTICSHRTNENRGLLTQAIHNAVLEQARQVNWIPFLFFPDGITYFVPKNADRPDLSCLPETVRKYLLQTAEKGLGQLIKRDPTKGIISCKPEMLEAADAETAAITLIRQTFTILNDKRTPAAGARREKILGKFPDLKTLRWNYPVNTIQVDRLAEGLRGLVGLLKDYYDASYEAASEALLNALSLQNYLNELLQIPSDGGVPHAWYYLAGNYLQNNPGLNDVELEKFMQTGIQSVLEKWGKPDRPLSFNFLDQYISQVLILEEKTETHDFVGELDRYHRNKAKRRRANEAICAICNSAFDVREEATNYSNKRATSLKQDSKRGVCSICEAERLLRQYSLGHGLAAEDEVVYLHLYPDYFFTPETSAILDRAYQRFAQSVFSEIDKELSQYHYDPKYVPRADIFRVNLSEDENQKRRLDKVKYPKGQMHGYYLLGVPSFDKKPTDTETWFMPSLLSLLAPVVFGVKVVASRVTLPPYDSGADFKETVIIDGVHPFWLHGMKKVRFRLDGFRDGGGVKGLEKAIPAALAFYSLTSQAFRSRKLPVWNALNTVAQALDTSPLYVFHYSDRILEYRKQGKSKVKDPSIYLAEDLLLYYKLLSDYYGGDDLMQMISDLVDKYACFYRAKGFAAYARLRPLNEAAKRVLESPPQTSKEDLQLMIEGYLLSLVDGVLDKKVDGFIPKGAAKDKIQLVSDFTRHFLDQVFYEYCRGERSLLRQNINLIRHAAEAYYVKNYLKKADDEAS
jgi:CRISPR-associated protein Csc3